MLETILTAVAPFLPIIGAIVLVIVVLLLTIKVVSGNEVLVVTGVGATKKVVKKIKVMKGGEEVEEEQVTYEPKIKIAGASVVIPFIQQSRKFDICVRKAAKDGDTMKTMTGVEIVIDWSISYAPNADSNETLQPCIRQFLDKNPAETEDIVMSSVAGGMRAVISTMTPQQVMVGKETLDEAVQKNIAGQMAELGYKVQIYIQEVRDADGSTYYADLAAQDREETRKQAAIITAEAKRAAKQAELEADVAIAERQRDADLKKAEFKAATDRANADAEAAGKLQSTERERELAERQGSVEVTRQQQADLAAQAEQTVRVTKAETEKREKTIQALADAEVAKARAEGEAEAAKKTAIGDAEVAKARAQGDAEAAKLKANGEAEAMKLRAEAEATKTKVSGSADAEVVKMKAAADAEDTRLKGEAKAHITQTQGEAEAEATRARGVAEAEAAKRLSDAQAANERVNFQLEALRIEAEAQIKIASSVAEVMAKIGENATFYDFGGSRDDKSDLLTGIMSKIPELFAKANLQNQALNGEALPDTISKLVESFVSPFGALAEKKTIVTPAVDGAEEPKEESAIIPADNGVEEPKEESASSLPTE